MYCKRLFVVGLLVMNACFISVTGIAANAEQIKPEETEEVPEWLILYDNGVLIGVYDDGSDCVTTINMIGETGAYQEFRWCP